MNTNSSPICMPLFKSGYLSLVLLTIFPCPQDRESWLALQDSVPLISTNVLSPEGNMVVEKHVLALKDQGCRFGVYIFQPNLDDTRFDDPLTALVRAETYNMVGKPESFRVIVQVAAFRRIGGT